MKANVTKVGWTATVDGKEYGSFMALTDAPLHNVEKAIELMSKHQLDVLRALECEQSGHVWVNEFDSKRCDVCRQWQQPVLQTTDNN